MEEKKLYAYPCDEFTGCEHYLDSLDENNCTTLGLCEFARRHCENCPDCVVMDLSYEEAESYLKKKNTSKDTH